MVMLEPNSQISMGKTTSEKSWASRSMNSIVNATMSNVRHQQAVRADAERHNEKGWQVYEKENTTNSQRADLILHAISLVMSPPLRPISGGLAQRHSETLHVS